MEDLLKLNEVASAIKTEIIPPGSNKTMKARNPLVLMGTCMNVMTEPLHQTDKALPRGLHVCPTYNCGSQRTTVQLYNNKDHAIIIKKGTAVARMVATNEVPEMVVANGTVGELQTRRWAKEGHTKLTVKDRKGQRKGPQPHDIFALEDGEMGCTEAAKHKIEVTDPKPFKVRLRNIPSGLLEEVKTTWTTC